MGTIHNLEPGLTGPRKPLPITELTTMLFSTKCQSLFPRLVTSQIIPGVKFMQLNERAAAVITEVSRVTYEVPRGELRDLGAAVLRFVEADTQLHVHNAVTSTDYDKTIDYIFKKWSSASDVICGIIDLAASHGEAHHPLVVGLNAFSDAATEHWDFQYINTPTMVDAMRAAGNLIAINN